MVAADLIVLANSSAGAAAEKTQYRFLYCPLMQGLFPGVQNPGGYCRRAPGQKPSLGVPVNAAHAGAELAVADLCLKIR